MWWRLARSEFDRRRGEGNRQLLKGIVDSGRVPGILAYAGGQPVGWCSVAPREEFASLERSRTLQRVDDQPVWSVVCFYVARKCRRQRLTAALLRAAVEYARDHGAGIVEGYPVEPRETISSATAYTGIASVFRGVGFVEVLRRSEKRPIMRYYVNALPPAGGPP